MLATRSTLILIAFAFLFSCSFHESNKEREDAASDDSIPQDTLWTKWINQPFILDQLDGLQLANCHTIVSDNLKSKYLLVYYFGSGCSICIGDLMEWYSHMNTSKLGERVDEIYIDSHGESDLLEFYLEQNGFEIRKCLYLEKQSEMSNFIYRLGLEGSATYIFLLDNQGKIQAIGNPFKSEMIAEIYKEFTLL